MSERVGVWIVGALGDVATTLVLGAGAIARDLAPTTGLVSEAPPLACLPTVPLGALVFAGHDVREGTPQAAAANLARAGVIPVSLLAPLEGELAAYAARIRPGVTFGAGELVRGLESSGSAALRASGPREALSLLRQDLAAFREAEGLSRIVVVALASTEPLPEPLPELESLEGLQALIASDDLRVPASVLYAVAAMEEGCAYVNFTPSLGSTPAGVAALAEARGVPHMGKDGKTGQTLVRTALAPMFAARNFQVASWAGFNILGNRDGEVLEEPGANAAKTTGKDKVLGAILGDRLGTSLTRIDYVPSLGDWKTAWDHVHFQGFLGTQMHLELTWRGADSALAAPLVLDLVRLLELAQRQGRAGLQPGLASFFKTPEGTAVQSFPDQLQLLEGYARELGGECPGALWQRWFDEVWGRQELEAVDSLTNPETKFHLGEQVMSPLDFKGMHGALLERFSALVGEVRDPIVQGEQVSVRTSLDLTCRESGQTFRLQGQQRAIVREGKFVEVWDCWDWTPVLEASGTIPPESLSAFLAAPARD